MQAHVSPCGKHPWWSRAELQKEQMKGRGAGMTANCASINFVTVFIRRHSSVPKSDGWRVCKTVDERGWEGGGGIGGEDEGEWLSRRRKLCWVCSRFSNLTDSHTKVGISVISVECLWFKWWSGSYKLSIHFCEAVVYWSFSVMVAGSSPDHPINIAKAATPVICLLDNVQVKNRNRLFSRVPTFRLGKKVWLESPNTGQMGKNVFAPSHFT